MRKNLGKKKVVIYTDGSLLKGNEGKQQRMRYSIVQIDEQNKIVCSHKVK